MNTFKYLFFNTSSSKNVRIFTCDSGTLLQGSVKVGDVLEIPVIRAEKKVKSIQMFRVGVPRIEQGDR